MYVAVYFHRLCALFSFKAAKHFLLFVHSGDSNVIPYKGRSRLHCCHLMPPSCLSVLKARNVLFGM